MADKVVRVVISTTYDGKGVAAAQQGFNRFAQATKEFNARLGGDADQRMFSTWRETQTRQRLASESAARDLRRQRQMLVDIGREYQNWTPSAPRMMGVGQIRPGGGTGGGRGGGGAAGGFAGMMAGRGVEGLGRMMRGGVAGFVGGLVASEFAGAASAIREVAAAYGESERAGQAALRAMAFQIPVIGNLLKGYRDLSAAIDGTAARDRRLQRQAESEAVAEKAYWGAAGARVGRQRATAAIGRETALIGAEGLAATRARIMGSYIDPLAESADREKAWRETAAAMGDPRIRTAITATADAEVEFRKGLIAQRTAELIEAEREAELELGRERAAIWRQQSQAGMARAAAWGAAYNRNMVGRAGDVGGAYGEASEEMRQRHNAEVAAALRVGAPLGPIWEQHARERGQLKASEDARQRMLDVEVQQSRLGVSRDRGAGLRSHLLGIDAVFGEQIRAAAPGNVARLTEIRDRTKQAAIGGFLIQQAGELSSRLGGGVSATPLGPGVVGLRELQESRAEAWVRDLLQKMLARLDEIARAGKELDINVISLG